MRISDWSSDVCSSDLFGSLVDHHSKKRIMLASSAGSLVLYAGSLAFYVLTPEEALVQVEGVTLWGFILLVILAVICGNIRMIALTTLVTVLIKAIGRASGRERVRQYV